MDVTVTVPAYEEGDAMLPTLRSIAEQETPDHWNVTREVWVTLSPKDKELCTTWQAALKAEGFDVYEAPEGKLSTRNVAHDHAVENGADAIVVWDADGPAINRMTLYELVRHLEEPGVVGVRGTPVSDRTPLGIYENVKRTLSRPVLGHMHGQLSAFTPEGWRHAGPFREDIDQTALVSVWKEEELGFARRLRGVGDVHTANEAKVHNSWRRTACKVSRTMQKTGREPSFDHCGGRGGTTFAPRDRR